MSIGKPSHSGDSRPDQPQQPGHRPFPGQGDRPRPEPPPADNRSPAQLRRDRESMTPREYAAIKEKETAVRAAAKGTTAKDSAQAITQHGSSPRDQARPGSNRAGESTSPGHDVSGPAGKTSTARNIGHDPGNDLRSRPPAQHDSTRPAGRGGTPEASRTSESSYLAGDTDAAHRPDAPASAQSAGKGMITHMHSEARGQKLDLYTDGTHWVSGDAVRAAQAETERKPAAQRHDITDVPPMREQGRNIVGEKPDRSPGDTTDLPPTGEKLVEMEDMDVPRSQRFGRKFLHEYNDFVDAAKNETDVVRNVLAHPAPTGHAETTPPVRTPGYSDVPSHTAPDPSAIVEATLVTGLVLFRTGQVIAHRVNRERRSEDDGH